jgi:hypothetical protein
MEFNKAAVAAAAAAAAKAAAPFFNFVCELTDLHKFC